MYLAESPNPYSVLASPRARQVGAPACVTDAAHARARKEAVTASFLQAKAEQDAVDAAHLAARAALEQGRAAEAQLGRELRELGTARRRAGARDLEALRAL